MRYLIDSAAACLVCALLFLSVAHAGPQEDCNDAPTADLRIAACNDVILLNPRDAVAYIHRGNAYSSRDDRERAIADYDEAIRIDPYDKWAYIAYMQRGIAHFKNSDYDHAIPDFSRTITINPSDINSYEFRALAYSNKGEYERAILDYGEVIRLKPNDASAFASRGDEYLRKGDHDHAIADYNQSNRLNPRDASIIAKRGKAYEAKGDRVKAFRDYNDALALPANNQLDRYVQGQVQQWLAALQNSPPAAAKVIKPTPLAGGLLGRRVALIIGNASYKIGPLQNPGNDATAVAAALRDTLKFDNVILRRDLGGESFRVALREFGREAEGAGLGLVYFAGHGIEVGGRNFLIPVDAALAAVGDLELEAVTLDSVLAQLAGVTILKLVILDACRNNPFPLAGAQRGISRGLARIEPEENTLVLYAAKDGTTAIDGLGGSHSPFTEAILKHIATPGLEIRFLLGEVRDDVMAATGRSQQPYVYGSLGRTKIYLQP